MNAADRKARYARSFPVLSGEVVTQGHADWCRDHGHATNRVDGVLDPFCPRCGAGVGETEQPEAVQQEDLMPVVPAPKMESEIYGTSTAYRWRVPAVNPTTEVYTTGDDEISIAGTTQHLTSDSARNDPLYRLLDDPCQCYGPASDSARNDPLYRLLDDPERKP